MHTYSISASSATVKAGASTEVLFTVTDESGNIVTPSTSRISGNMATVASSDSSIATVAIVSGNKLKISGESVGTANITINYGTASANFEVIVEAPDSVGAPAAMVNADELETLTVYRTEKGLAAYVGGEVRQTVYIGADQKLHNFETDAVIELAPGSLENIQKLLPNRLRKKEKLFRIFHNFRRQNSLPAKAGDYRIPFSGYWQ